MYCMQGCVCNGMKINMFKFCENVSTVVREVYGLWIICECVSAEVIYVRGDRPWADKQRGVVERSVK